MEDDSIPPAMEGHLPPRLDGKAFERFVAKMLSSVKGRLDRCVVTPHERINTPGGAFDIDVTVRFQLNGLDFLILVEVKNHRNPIKRESVQILADKVSMARAQKGVLVSSAPFQSGALVYAREHHIALIRVTEETSTWHTRFAGPRPLLHRSRREHAHPLLDARHWSLTHEGRLESISVAGDTDELASLLVGGRVS